MDFFLVLAEWLDLGLTGMGLVLGTVLYRRRALVTDTLWWIREAYRQQALAAALDAFPAASEDRILADLERQWGRSLSPHERFMAHYLLDGINCRKDEGKDGDQ